MLMLLKAALVICTVEMDLDDSYFAVCEGRQALMESAILNQTKGLCKVYSYEQWDDNLQSFVVLCDDSAL